MTPARLRVVVVTRSSGDVLPRFVDTLRAATAERHELVVVDNASPEGAPACPEGARLLQSSGDLGYARAATFGAGRFEGEVLVLADPAVVWAPGSLDQLVAALERWPRAGCAGPAIRTRTRSSIARSVKASRSEGLARSLPGSVLAVRRTAWAQVGGLTSDDARGGAAADLCRRLRRAGWQSVYVPSAEVTLTSELLEAR